MNESSSSIFEEDDPNDDDIIELGHSGFFQKVMDNSQDISEEQKKLWDERLFKPNVYIQQKTNASRDREPFMVFMANNYVTDSVETDQTVIRTHSTLGATRMYSVPSEKEIEVLKYFHDSVFIYNQPAVLAQCIGERTQSKYFPWFSDLDLKFSKEPSIQFIRRIVEVVIQTVSEFFPQLKELPYKPPMKNGVIIDPKTVKSQEELWDNVSCLWFGAGEGIGRLRFAVCTSGMKRKRNIIILEEPDESNPVTKKSTNRKKPDYNFQLGLHLYNIGRCLVNHSQALLMRVAIIHNLEKKLGRRKEEDGNSWEDIVDASVYKGFGGMRILGSSKVIPCPKCWKKPDFMTKEQEIAFMEKYKGIQTFTGIKGNASKCDCHHGSFLQHLAYEAKLIVDHNGFPDSSMDFLLHDSLGLVLATNLRTTIIGGDDTTWWKTKKGYDLEQLKPSGPKQTHQQTQIDIKNPKKENKNSPFYWKKGEGCVDTSMEVMQELIQEVRKIDEKYESLYASSLVKLNDGVETNGKFRLDISQKMSSNWNWCLKCEKYHKNRIWFLIDRSGIYQESYSDNSECKSTIGKIKKRQISQRLSELLFNRTQSLPYDNNSMDSESSRDGILKNQAKKRRYEETKKREEDNNLIQSLRNVRNQ